MNKICMLKIIAHPPSILFVVEGISFCIRILIENDEKYILTFVSTNPISATPRAMKMKKNCESKGAL